MATAEWVEDAERFGWPATIGQLEALPGFSGQRHELIEGDIVVTPPPGAWHQDVAYHLIVGLGPILEERGLAARENRGVLFSGEVDMFIPDIVVYRSGRPTIRDVYLDPADLVLAVEIVSHSSRRRDRQVKPAVLAEHGVPFYLLVDPFPRPVHLTLFELVDGAYEERARVEAGTSLHLPVPFDLDLDTSQLA